MSSLGEDSLPADGMIRQPELAALYQFWLEKKSLVGRIPSRTDFSPRELGKLLPHVALVDVERNGHITDFTFRLCGTQIVEDSGADLTGKTWSAYPNSERMIERARQLVQELTPYYACNIQAEWAPKSFHHYSVLALPLCAEDGHPNMILYGILFHPYMK